MKAILCETENKDYSGIIKKFISNSKNLRTAGNWVEKLSCGAARISHDAVLSSASNLAEKQCKKILFRYLVIARRAGHWWLQLFPLGVITRVIVQVLFLFVHLHYGTALWVYCSSPAIKFFFLKFIFF